MFVLIVIHFERFMLEFRRIPSSKFQLERGLNSKKGQILLFWSNSNFLSFFVNLDATSVVGSALSREFCLQSVNEKFAVTKEKFHFEVVA